MYLVLHAFHALLEHTSQPLINQAALLVLRDIIPRQLAKRQHVLHPVQRALTQRLERPLARVAQRDTIHQLPLNQAAQVARQDIIQQRLASHQHALQPVQEAIIQLQERRPAPVVPRGIIPQPHQQLPVPHVHQVLTLQQLRPRVRLVLQDTAALGPPR